MISLPFDLGEDLDMLRDSVRQFAQTKWHPVPLPSITTMCSQKICGKNLVIWDCWGLPSMKNTAVPTWGIWRT